MRRSPVLRFWISIIVTMLAVGQPACTSTPEAEAQTAGAARGPGQAPPAAQPPAAQTPAAPTQADETQATQSQEAQGAAQSQPAPFTSEELEQIAAPIALYPDALLAQVLMASTYPLEIVEAARWSKAHPDVKGDAVSTEMEKQSWDPSVKSLVAFPEVLAMMNEKLDWTQKLGDAVLAQRKDLMDAVQRLRTKAKDSGNLTSSSEQTVKTEPAPAGSSTPQTIIIESPSPDVVYVPTYDPMVVYGAWPYPAYPPYYYYPPGYVAGATFFSFGVGVFVGSALWGGCNWGHHDIDVNVNRYNNFNHTNLNRGDLNGGSWQHNPTHRQGVGYRDAATQQRYGRASSPQSVQAREEFRGRAEQGRQQMSREGAAGQRDLSRGPETAARAGSSQAFSGVGNGASTRAQSSRGMSSRAGMSRGGGRRR